MDRRLCYGEMTMTFSDIMTGSDFDIALGGMGDDLIDFTTLPQDQISTLQNSGGVEAIALFGGNDNISGSDDSTIIFGNKGNDTILGNGGDDTLFGGMDNDQIRGGAGNDNINGDLGDDTLSGGAGTDILTGRDGADVFVLTQGEDTDTITDFVSGVDRVQLPDGLAESDVTIEGGEIRVTVTGEILAQVNGAIASGDLIVATTDDGGGGPPEPGGGLLSRRTRSTNPLNEALQLATSQLASFADTPEFAAQIQENFGDVDIELAESLIAGLTSGENLPPVEVRSPEELGNIEGGYDAVTGTVYLNENLLSAPDPQIVASVILEEWGHHLDAQLNTIDRVGDEGAEFAMRVQGQILDAQTLDALRGFDDTVTINLDGQVTDLETGEYSNRWYINIYDWSSGSTERVVSGKTSSNRRSDGKTGFLADWQSGSPNRGVGSDYFMNQMWTQDDFQAGKTYNFKVRSDDGFRIAARPVNGGEWQFITPWSWQTAYGSQHKNYSFTPKQSGEHWIYVLHYEEGGLAYFDVSWSASSSSSGKQYYPQLSGLSDNTWDRETSDNTGFDDNWPDYEYDEALTRSEIEQIYTDLSNDLFGRRYHMTAGYMDPGYHADPDLNGWHAGIDLGAPAGTRVRAVAPGTVAWKDGSFIGITSSTGQHQWVYGHMNLNNISVGSSISKGQNLGTINGDNHLHFETRTPAGFSGTGGAHPNKDFIRNATRSPLQTYWLSRA